jgi:hypothetical protein
MQNITPRTGLALLLLDITGVFSLVLVLFGFTSMGYQPWRESFGVSPLNVLTGCLGPVSVVLTVGAYVFLLADARKSSTRHCRLVWAGCLLFAISLGIDFFGVVPISYISSLNGDVELFYTGIWIKLISLLISAVSVIFLVFELCNWYEKIAIGLGTLASMFAFSVQSVLAVRFSLLKPTMMNGTKVFVPDYSALFKAPFFWDVEWANRIGVFVFLAAFIVLTVRIWKDLSSRSERMVLED